LFFKNPKPCFSISKILIFKERNEMLALYSGILSILDLFFSNDTKHGVTQKNLSMKKKQIYKQTLLHGGR
jgi:hypothetical protein